MPDPSVTQSVATDLPVILTDTAGLPKTGVTFGQVTATQRKYGAGSFSAKTLNSGNWTEIGSGFYTIGFSSSELDTLGSLTYVVTGSGIQQFTGAADVIPATVVSNPVATLTATLTGNINSPSGGYPVEGAVVAAKLIGVQVRPGGVGLQDRVATAKTDKNGAFVLPLPRLAQVEVFIPAINYRRQLTVPNVASVNLFTGIP